jgi:cobalt/nickel transport system ATP-binding protein
MTPARDSHYRSRTEPLLRVAGLSYWYPTGRCALAEVSLTIDPGERVALVGPNGAGKTTLLHHLNGLLPGDAARKQTTSPVELLGMPVIPANYGEIRRLVGLVFQNPDDQLFCATVAEDVAFGPSQLGLDSIEVRRRVAAAIEAVGLTGKETSAPFQLSIGERRRACLAGVLAGDAALLVLDEPTSNLDPRSRRQLLDCLGNLPAAQLIATHDLELVLDLCSRVIVLDNGRVQAEGNPSDVLGDAPLMEAHGLEVPLSIRLGGRRENRSPTHPIRPRVTGTDGN